MSQRPYERDTVISPMLCLTETEAQSNEWLAQVHTTSEQLELKFKVCLPDTKNWSLGHSSELFPHWISFIPTPYSTVECLFNLQNPGPESPSSWNPSWLPRMETTLLFEQLWHCACTFLSLELFAIVSRFHMRLYISGGPRTYLMPLRIPGHNRCSVRVDQPPIWQTDRRSLLDCSSEEHVTLTFPHPFETFCNMKHATEHYFRRL